MANDKLSKDDAAAFRRRVEYEDGLLNTRTNNVLTLNGLAAVAVGLISILPGARLCISVVIIIINAVWIFCATEALWFISELTEKLKQAIDVIPPDEAFRFRLFEGRKRIPPTKYIAVIVPLLLLAGWVFGLLWHVGPAIAGWITRLSSH